jgi:hypothetical protein
LAALLVKRIMKSFSYNKFEIEIPLFGIKIIDPAFALTEKEYENFKIE